MSELIGPSPPQWLVDLFRLCNFAWRQARPSRILLANVRPEAFPVVENLLIEVSPVISIGAAPLDFAPGNRRPVEEWALCMPACTRQDRDSPCRGTGNLPDRSRGLRMVHKLHWRPRDSAEASEGCATSGPAADENRDGEHYGQNCYGSSLHKVLDLEARPCIRGA